MDLDPFVLGPVIVGLYSDVNVAKEKLLGFI